MFPIQYLWQTIGTRGKKEASFAVQLEQRFAFQINGANYSQKEGKDEKDPLND